MEVEVRTSMVTIVPSKCFSLYNEASRNCRFIILLFSNLFHCTSPLALYFRQMLHISKAFGNHSSYQSTHTKKYSMCHTPNRLLWTWWSRKERSTIVSSSDIIVNILYSILPCSLPSQSHSYSCLKASGFLPWPLTCVLLHQHLTWVTICNYAEGRISCSWTGILTRSFIINTVNRF